MYSTTFSRLFVYLSVFLLLSSSVSSKPTRFARDSDSAPVAKRAQKPAPQAKHVDIAQSTPHNTATTIAHPKNAVVNANSKNGAPTAARSKNAVVDVVHSKGTAANVASQKNVIVDAAPPKNAVKVATPKASKKVTLVNGAQPKNAAAITSPKNSLANAAHPVNAATPKVSVAKANTQNVNEARPRGAAANLATPKTVANANTSKTVANANTPKNAASTKSTANANANANAATHSNTNVVTPNTNASNAAHPNTNVANTGPSANVAANAARPPNINVVNPTGNTPKNLQNGLQAAPVAITSGGSNQTPGVTVNTGNTAAPSPGSGFAVNAATSLNSAALSLTGTNQPPSADGIAQGLNTAVKALAIESPIDTAAASPGFSIPAGNIPNSLPVPATNNILSLPNIFAGQPLRATAGPSASSNTVSGLAATVQLVDPALANLQQTTNNARLQGLPAIATLQTTPSGAGLPVVGSTPGQTNNATPNLNVIANAATQNPTVNGDLGLAGLTPALTGSTQGLANGTPNLFGNTANGNADVTVTGSVRN